MNILIESNYLLEDFMGNQIEKSNSDMDTYSVIELQEILGVGKSTIYKLIMANLFESSYVEYEYRISKKSFDVWFNKMKNDVFECQDRV